MSKLKALILASLLAAGFSAQAEVPRHEVTTNLTRGIFYSGKECKDCSAGSLFDLGTAYNWGWKDNVQVGVEGRLQYLSKEFSVTADSATLIDALAVGTYNISNDFANSIYAKLGLGIFAVRNDAGDNYENQFGLFVGIGKRFYMMNNLSYMPEVRFIKKGDLDMSVQVDLINFSFYW